MFKQEVLEYFGAGTRPGAMTRCAKFLELESVSAVMQWGEIIPEGAAYKLEVLTAGALKVDPEIYRRQKKRKLQARREAAQA